MATGIAQKTIDSLNEFYKDFPYENGMLESILGSPEDSGVIIQREPIPLTKWQKTRKFLGFKVKMLTKVNLISIQYKPRVKE